jgi:putative ABC transport system substrate-binding protein
MGRPALRRSRRRFLRGSLALAGMGLLAGCGGLLPEAPAPRKTPRIGRVWSGNITADHADAFREQLRELGYVDDQSVIIEDRVAEGRPEPLPDLVAELVRLPVDAIVTVGTPATLAARQATSTIPIVQASGVADLIREGVAASLARPGGNVTGLATIGEELTAKRLDLLKQTLPGLRRVAVLWNPASPSTSLSWTETQAAAPPLGLELHSLEVRSPDELDGLVAAARGARRGAGQGEPPAVDVRHAGVRGRRGADDLRAQGD